MKLSEEMAVRLHRMMWSDMQRELGDKPSEEDRLTFKSEWIEKNFPGRDVLHRCFLCEYAQQMYSDKDFSICHNCPIVWPGDFCNGVIKSYATMPISEILALPAKNESFDKKAVNIHDLSRDIVVGEVAKASGLPVECDIWSHIKAIQEKAVQRSTFSKMYCDAKTELAKASGLPEADTITDHIKSIQDKARDNTRNNLVKELAEVSGRPVNLDVWRHIKAIKDKAVEEYFEKQPAAKMISMDVDNAFKQYADEQKAPIFLALAEASGLSASNESVKAHVSRIRDTAKQNGRIEKCEDIYGALSEASGLSKGNWCLSEHVKAIQEKAKVPMESLRSANTLLADTVNRYKDALSKESDLDRNRPIDDHIREIVKNSMEAGATEERDRIQEKIYEVLLS